MGRPRPASSSTGKSSVHSSNSSSQGRGRGGGGRRAPFGAVYDNDVQGQPRPTSPAPVGNPPVGPGRRMPPNQANNSLIALLNQMRRNPEFNQPFPAIVPLGTHHPSIGEFAPTTVQFPTPLAAATPAAEYNYSTNLGWFINNTTDANSRARRPPIVIFFYPCFYCNGLFTDLDMSYSHMSQMHGWQGTAHQSTQSTQTHGTSVEQLQQPQAQDPRVLNDSVQLQDATEGEAEQG